MARARKVDRTASLNMDQLNGSIERILQSHAKAKFMNQKNIQVTYKNWSKTPLLSKSAKVGAAQATPFCAKSAAQQEGLPFTPSKESASKFHAKMMHTTYGNSPVDLQPVQLKQATPVNSFMQVANVGPHPKIQMGAHLVEPILKPNSASQSTEGPSLAQAEELTTSSAAMQHSDAARLF